VLEVCNSNTEEQQCW